MMTECFACGEGHFYEIVELSEVAWKGYIGKVPLYYQKCYYCNTETATAEQTHLNKKLMERFKNKIDNGEY